MVVFHLKNELLHHQAPIYATQPATGRTNCPNKKENVLLLLVPPHSNHSLQWAIQDSNLNSQSKSDKEVSENTNPKRVQNRVQKTEICPDLEQIITTWPQLPEQVKKTIIELVQKHIPEQE